MCDYNLYIFPDGHKATFFLFLKL